MPTAPTPRPTCCTHPSLALTARIALPRAAKKKFSFVKDWCFLFFVTEAGGRRGRGRGVPVGCVWWDPTRTLVAVGRPRVHARRPRPPIVSRHAAAQRRSIGASRAARAPLFCPHTCALLCFPRGVPRMCGVRAQSSRRLLSLSRRWGQSSHSLLLPPQPPPRGGERHLMFSLPSAVTEEILAARACAGPRSSTVPTFPLSLMLVVGSRL